jgi:hypothetical protein
LYANSANQPHQWASLFSDTSVYFLTILPDTSVIVSKRFSFNTSVSYNSFTPETHFIHEVKVFPTIEYVDGINLNPGGEKYNSSEYTDGEGWSAYRAGLGESQQWTFNTPNYAAVSTQPTIDVKVIGVSDYVFGNPPNNHHARISIAKFETPSFATVTDFIYKGYASRKYAGVLSSSNFGASKTIVKMDIVNDLAVSSDFNALSYIKLTYPRLYNLNGETDLYVNVIHTQGAIRSRLSVLNYGSGQANPLAYDFTSGQRIVGVMNGANSEILVDNNGKPHQIYIFDSIQRTPITQLSPVNFQLIDPANAYEMIMVSHAALDNAATAYENYRSQQFKVLKIYANELYDFYTYGNVHPLAIRRLAAHLLKEAPQPPQYLLLLGKGYQGNLLKDQSYVANNLVPAIGVPASDVMFSSGILGNGFTNDIATGRIPAATNEELQFYLDKLIDYETNPDSIIVWRKNMLHISGGENLSQQTQFKNQLAFNAQSIRGKKFGGNVIAFSKDNSSSVSVDLKQQIINQTFGHVSIFEFRLQLVFL